MSNKLTKLELLSKSPSRIDINISVNFMGKFGVSDLMGTKYMLKTPESFLDRIKKMGVCIDGVGYSDGDWFYELQNIETKLALDYTFIETLMDNKQDKDILYDYASAVFSVKLNKRKSLKSMIEDLESKV